MLTLCFYSKNYIQRVKSCDKIAQSIINKRGSIVLNIAHLRFSLLAFCCFTLFSSFSSNSEEVTVVYPDVKPPYNKIFKQIIRGIARSEGVDLAEIKVKKTSDIDSIPKLIKTQKVIALGRRGLSVAEQIHQQKNVVIGAYPLKQGQLSGVSLMAKPSSLFNFVKELAPNVTAITVVYSKDSQWIVELAKADAKASGLALNAIYVDSLKSAVKSYDKIFEQGDESNAIWLPMDTISAHDKVIVPAILEKAWRKKRVVFSSKPVHAKRGALFSSLPEHTLLGEQLASFVMNKRLESKAELKPLEHVKLAVNLRTAAHLGYRYNNSQRADFAITFPTNNE